MADGDGREPRARLPSADAPRRGDDARRRACRGAPSARVGDALGLDPRGGRRGDRRDREREDGGRAPPRVGREGTGPPWLRARRVRRRRPAARQRPRRADGLPARHRPAGPRRLLAFGVLVAPLQREFATSHIERFADVAAGDVAAILGRSPRARDEWLRERGFAEADRQLSLEVDVRYHKQGFEIPVTHRTLRGRRPRSRRSPRVSWPAHDREYGFRLELGLELVVVRCVATGLAPSPAVHAPPRRPRTPVDDAGDRSPPVYWDGGWIAGARLRPCRLGPGHRVEGPAVIEQKDSTTLVHPGLRRRAWTRI